MGEEWRGHHGQVHAPLAQKVSTPLVRNPPAVNDFQLNIKTDDCTLRLLGRGESSCVEPSNTHGAIFLHSDRKITVTEKFPPRQVRDALLTIHLSLVSFCRSNFDFTKNERVLGSLTDEKAQNQW